MSGGGPGGESVTGSTMENSWPLLSTLAHKKGYWLFEYNLVAPGSRLNLVAHCGEKQPQHKPLYWAPSVKTTLTRSDFKTQLLVTLPFAWVQPLPE